LHTGKEQLLVFLITIFFTLFEDLLVGILAGMLTELIVQIVFKVPFGQMFSAKLDVEKLDNQRMRVYVKSAAVFTNFLSIKKVLDNLPQGQSVEIDLSQAKMVDHTVMENLHFFENDYRNAGGHIHIIGLDAHTALSHHALAVRVKK
jgi:MFS superfamily sulfate permease-like transporter